MNIPDQKPDKPAENNKKRLIAQEYFDVLREEGFVPTYDGDGDVKFKYEGWLMLIIIDADDPLYLRLCFPGFKETKPEDQAAMLSKLNEVQKAVKIVKCVLVDTYVWAVIEAFIPDYAFFRNNLTRYLRILKTTSEKIINQSAS